MDERIDILIDEAKAQAHEYAQNYRCEDKYRPAVEASHFAYLINEAIQTIRHQAEHIEQTLWGREGC